MSIRPSNLAWVRSFEAAARHASFTRAAEELGLTQAAISHHIQALEQECRTKLFARGRRGVTLTPQGADYLALIQGPLLSIANSTQSMFSGRSTGSVTIALAPGIAMYWLMPRLKRLEREVPQAGVMLHSNYFHYPKVNFEPDFVIEFGTGSWNGLDSRCLFMDRLTPVCSPALACDDWEALPLISVLDGTAPWEDWFRMTSHNGKPDRRFTFDLFPYAFEAARLGHGVLLGPTVLLNPSIERGELTRLSPLELPTNGGYFLTRPGGKPLNETQKKVADWLIKEAAASQAE
jgi:DNA-binding transcriptional LysR family regulator